MLSLETGIAIVATLSVCYGLHSCDVDRITKNNNSTLGEQKNALTTECNTKTAITAGVDHDLQQSLNDINGRLTSGSVPIATCLPIFAGNTTSNNDPSGVRPVANTGLSTQWLRQKVAAPGSVYRVQLMACQELLIKERAMP